MAGPWERYAQQPTQQAEEQAPWLKFQQQTATPAQPPAAQPIPEQLQEQPGLIQRGIDLFTGRQQMTPEIEGL